MYHKTVSRVTDYMQYGTNYSPYNMGAYSISVLFMCNAMASMEVVDMLQLSIAQRKC